MKQNKGVSNKKYNTVGVFMAILFFSLFTVINELLLGHIQIKMGIIYFVFSFIFLFFILSFVVLPAITKLSDYLTNYLLSYLSKEKKIILDHYPEEFDLKKFSQLEIESNIPLSALKIVLEKPKKLNKKTKYLQIALNSNLNEARKIIFKIPQSERILIEVGTPLLKSESLDAVSYIKTLTLGQKYIVVDAKCSDLAIREVEMLAKAGADGITCLGVAPLETINAFIQTCKKFGIDSMIDMMNVENPLFVLKKLKMLPDVVILHRGVDETEFSKEKQIPYYQIQKIKGNYDVLVAVAGGDTIKEVQKAILNDADIVVVWKNFYQSTTETAPLAELFLKEIK